MFEKLIPYDAAHLILGSYLQYYRQFKRITKRAKIRFEHRDWHGIQADSRERILLYRDEVGQTTEQVLTMLGPQAHDRGAWREMKQLYLEEITNFNTRNIAETFYNSVFRHSHKGLSADEELMFVHATGSYREFRSLLPIFHTIFLSEPYELPLKQLFNFYAFDAEFEDLDRDIRYIAASIRANLIKEPPAGRPVQVEMLRAIYFRNKGAYLVGRIYLTDRIHPFVLPLLHEEKGIYVDTLLCTMNDVSSIFSYNRSYFLADTDIASETVDFLNTVLSTKSLGELYNSIGFEKHGKTVLYRDFLRYLAVSSEKFVHAPGIRGMVMIVFTLPSYNMVFKVIRDHFPAPKNVTEKEVKEKYALVSMHDRVGRMADSHMFENFVADLDRFDPALLRELREEAGSKVVIRDGKIEIKHLYIEKKMIPLNLYLETATLDEAEEVINEYGKAIKQLAAVNIFPGDMLLKNFGVTRLRRVVFYDYDEIGFLTDYNFRSIPEADDPHDEMSSEPWYSVGPNDVFPEEFPRFLIGRNDIREIFFKLHGDLFGPGFWIKMQEQLKEGKIMDVFPYRRRLRFKNVFSSSKTAPPHE